MGLEGESVSGEGKRTLCLGDGDLAPPVDVGDLRIVFGSSLGGLRFLWALRGSGLEVEERTRTKSEGGAKYDEGLRDSRRAEGSAEGIGRSSVSVGAAAADRHFVVDHDGRNLGGHRGGSCGGGGGVSGGGGGGGLGSSAGKGKAHLWARQRPGRPVRPARN
uniref:Uncharacterized protein n=1 Tax=Chromera velia CCMP2878 TaxID=1169474 RepID=A0A0G4HTI6_9ALVE|eukprot:Cvel_1349.t1-p1 / transcript=Cvel_1349.t1 / gene=Cvel_1349 / organism=Chromera_velia_CCMP2878 / gene_product=hypothetical protein / transcript_product=hypothetical protein / location=Cvel_scaffold46:81040-83000(-) / protein_length=161 / sequence_SO=supercontig / SO=protein_coding / is_pseudo=false